VLSKISAFFLLFSDYFNFMTFYGSIMFKVLVNLLVFELMNRWGFGGNSSRHVESSGMFIQL
jgi:hypothetical protein